MGQGSEREREIAEAKCYHPLALKSEMHAGKIASKINIKSWGFNVQTTTLKDLPQLIQDNRTQNNNRLESRGE